MGRLTENNELLNMEIERFIEQWDGTILGQEVKNMYENKSDYEAICERIGLNHEDCKNL